jgi:hypothetical protein
MKPGNRFFLQHGANSSRVKQLWKIRRADKTNPLLKKRVFLYDGGEE